MGISLVMWDCQSEIPTEPDEISSDQLRATPFTLDYVRAVIKEAKKVIPFDNRNDLTIGVLDREREETSCLIVYSNQDKSETYRFSLVEGEWSKGNQIERHYDPPDEILVFNGTVARVRSLKDHTDWHPYKCDDKTESGDYVKEWERLLSDSEWDEDDLFCTVDFIGGTEENNNAVWTVTLNSWSWERSVAPAFSGNTKQEYKLIYFRDWVGPDELVNYGAESVILNFHLEKEAIVPKGKPVK